MAASSSYMAFSMVGMLRNGSPRQLRNRRVVSVSAAQPQEVQVQEPQEEQENDQKQETSPAKQSTRPRPVEKQINVKNKNLTREYGGQWLSSTTRHVRIYAAYIDIETETMDQTQMDKLTIILDPTDEFLWNDETTTKVYSYFQELVDHYEGAPLTEYTLRLIGSDIEHYIRKLLYDGEIKYNMRAKTLNFSMGKPRILFNDEGSSDVQ
ncbi:NAD(P)H-quinone oxidoreductase subunit M, chloroplastic [Linum perenne]